MEDTRQRLLELLQYWGHASVDDLARGLGLTPPTVRRHLDILQRDGLVAYRLGRQKTGRPEHRYYLTERGQEALPKAYPDLLAWLVEELQANTHTSPLLEAALARIAQRLLGSFLQPLPPDAPMLDRLRALHRLLQAYHFAPHMEPLPNGVRIRLANCPFRAVARGHPAVCALDRGLIASALGVEPIQEQCLPMGHTTCAYLLTWKGTPPGTLK
ncbi:MAG: ArsR family transcriptional regulator [Dehalococcoidia bacterium]|nr:ArsR family transcriptional regulator [Dehalococcoidia bacterium]MDW8119515.1 ArsR family transcriptional regulator [Chloroflexota bacterium]